MTNEAMNTVKMQPRRWEEIWKLYIQQEVNTQNPQGI